MNTLRALGLVNEKYSSHFLHVVHKVSNPVFATPCTYSNTVMKSPLKEKIQNAINRAINEQLGYNDYNNNGDGALIVGGRRRNRKKKNKKNGQQKKKKEKTVDIKARLSPSGCRKGNNKQENAPLIGEDKGTDNKDSKVEEEGKENMPFSFLKKKKSKKDKAKDAEKNKEEERKDEVKEEEVKEKEKEDVTEEVTEKEITADSNGEVNAGQRVSFKVDAKEGEESNTITVEPGQPQNGEGTSTGKKSEKSPLIGENDPPPPGGSRVGKKVKTQTGGMLCCCIL